MKGFFDIIPVDLDESAGMDGATHTQVFFRIIPAVVFLLSFIFPVNDFVIARAVLGIADESNLTLGPGM